MIAVAGAAACARLRAGCLQTEKRFRRRPSENARRDCDQRFRVSSGLKSVTPLLALQLCAVSTCALHRTVRCATVTHRQRHCPMAEPPPASSSSTTPAPAGFKVKLKLGGSSIGHARTSSLSNDTPISNNATPSTSTSTTAPKQAEPAVAPAPPPSQGDVSMDGDADDLYTDQASIPDDGDDGDFTVGSSKKSKAKRASNTPTLTYSAPVDGQAGAASGATAGNYAEGSFTSGQPGPSLLAPPAAKKRKAPTANPGAGRGWRKGLKNIEKQEGVSLSLAGKAGGAATPPPSAPLPGKRRKAAVNMAEDGGEDDQDEDFVPTMVAPGGLAVSDKWQNGLPGGNEQSRQTAAIAAAVNKLFPVGPPPKVSRMRSNACLPQLDVPCRLVQVSCHLSPWISGHPSREAGRKRDERLLGQEELSSLFRFGREVSRCQDQGLNRADSPLM